MVKGYTPNTLIRGAFLAAHCLHVPCWTLLSLLSLILYKTLTISPWYVMVLIAIKPVSGLLAPYWSQAIHRRPDKLGRNLCYAQLLRYLPLSLLPWFHHPMWILFSYGLTMTMQRACVPAWMELMKRHLPEAEQAKLLSQAHMIDYIGVAVLSIPFGWLLDTHASAWGEIIAFSALIGLSSVVFLSMLMPLTPTVSEATSLRKQSVWGFSKWVDFSKNLPSRLSTFLFQPWRESWNLLEQEKSFARYLFGFMLGGAGLMIVQPGLPSFFIDTLHLSFVEMGCAIALCRAIGSLSSPLWSYAISRLNFSLFSAFVTLTAMLWPFFLLAAQLHPICLYFAYFLYGVMQAGSELSWHLSGVVFAKEKESSAFSTTNVLMVGVRGCIVPTLGACLLALYGATMLLWMGMILSCLATVYFAHNSSRAVSLRTTS